jgi:alpha-L-fucosidase
MYTQRFFCGLLSFILLTTTIFVGCKSNTPVDPPKPYGVLPSDEQIEWQKMEYYMFIHFGPNTFTDVEWGNGKENPKVFNPTDLDCRQWAATAKAAGMKAIIITAKHHDGFCLWPSKYSTHTVRESLWKEGKGDILKELSEACKEYGLQFGVYLSPWDQNHPSYGTPEYNTIFANTLDEVLGNYGEIFEQWFDGANGDANHPGKKQVYDWDMFHKAVYKKQPKAIIFSDIGPGCRWMGNERGVAGETNWSRLDIEGFQPGLGAPPTDTLNTGNIYGKAWVPAETDVSIRPGWFYSPTTNDKVKSIDHLLDIYHTSVGRNSNLLLNVPPDRRGKIHPNDSTRLVEFKKAIDAIFENDLTKDAKATALETRGKSTTYAPSNLLDNNYDSYWTTNDNKLTASVEIELKQATTFNRVLLQEYIPLGQRIAQFNIEAWINNQWQTISSGTTIGYKRILRFPSVTSSKIRINIQNALACPIISKVGLFIAPEKLSAPIISRNKAGMVSILCDTTDPLIYYTTDGSIPSNGSKSYQGEFSCPDVATIKAVALIENGKQKSEIISATFDIAPTKWNVIAPLSEGIEHIIDGNDNSFASIKNKDAIVIDFGETIPLKGFSYHPLSNEQTNHIYRYDAYTSNNGTDWNKIKANATFDNIKNNPIKQVVLFDKTTSAQFIKIVALETSNKQNSYPVAEIGIITR